jgi:peptide chain release factor
MKDLKTIIITAGKGPIECAWVVSKVQKILIAEAKAFGLNWSILNRIEGSENTTLQSVKIMLEGNYVSLFLKQWLGTIKWTEQSAFRKNHGRKNWFIGVFEEISSMELQINDKDIEYQAIKSGGAGGQHINKVSTAVRAKHLPTGLQVLAQDSRSQYQNKKLAYQRLCEKFKSHQIEIMKNNQHQNWENHISFNRGNAVRAFSGGDFKPKNEQLSYKKTRLNLKLELKKIE